ncbi:MAG: hypothetical protein QG641_3011, partial [Candidatus Poribacteria bacterium]|nr:hypothetical protein [Candidatus Poribacteria bacterium]
LKEAEIHEREALKMAEIVGRNYGIAAAHWMLGIIAMANHHWDSALYHNERYVEETDIAFRARYSDLAYLELGKALLKTGDLHSALKHFKSAMEELIYIRTSKCWLYQALLMIEETYSVLGNPDEFRIFCSSLREKYITRIKDIQLNQFYLESASPSDEFRNLTFANDFDKDGIDPSWTWLDEFSDCTYRIADEGGLEIHASNGRDFVRLRLDAPHFMRTISGDFAIEVCVSSVTNEKPYIGGLFAKKELNNYLSFQKGMNGKNEINLYGNLDGEPQFPGRGLLPASQNDETYLRLERSGDEFKSYCSIDGKNWFTCGKMILPMEDPIQVGIYATGMIDRTIYCGEYKEGTATLFRNFKLWTK